jgi:hypothetical protein
MLFGHGVKRFNKLSTHSRKSFQSSPFSEDLIYSKVFIRYIDWSALGIIVIFSQLDGESKEYVIAYAS